MANPTWCCKCSSRVGMSSDEFGSITFKGKVSGVKMGHEFKLCGRCVKKISLTLKDRNSTQKKSTQVSKIIVHPRETNVTEKKIYSGVVRT